MNIYATLNTDNIKAMVERRFDFAGPWAWVEPSAIAGALGIEPTTSNLKRIGMAIRDVHYRIEKHRSNGKSLWYVPTNLRD